MFLHWYVDICTISYPFSPHFGMFHISDALCLQPWSNKTLRCSRCIMHGRKWHNCTWICLLVYCFLFFHNFLSRCFLLKGKTGRTWKGPLMVTGGSVCKLRATARAGKWGGLWTTSRCWTDSCTDACTTESSVCWRK